MMYKGGAGILPANHQGRARIPIPQNWVIYFLVFPNELNSMARQASSLSR
ncbi:hypothetical protein MEO40_06070 [Dolichospermum sp. ST_sed1]|jgi:hypothetical protein|nr:hypothetical protein [Dolichospermum sp. ST_sed1]MDD1428555.1 hypothetical protein [Dolichospermum sp. ST_sed9]MDD1434061.1 hypothetical protein [Dolichospermum sp. ST_sed6]MDD1435899.1 hypothetical protein [Dolichospermum sp. ST_sed10]MDD1443939.1 hypothetical protein [Dolichospermum sp. ST_sed3]MDD1447362.1 hypothetical protein [Dolichospermum sp. ST_sed8]MDD1456246.1 hypothetical protein [Dolichospermum sp. ST_sed7]MDD1469184.1 hypothetical protein [Dolichospermum sp. ST_sed5]MDD14743